MIKCKNCTISEDCFVCPIITSIVESSNMMTYITEIDGKVLACNELGAKYFNIPKEMVVGRTLKDLCEAGDYEDKRKVILESILRGKPITMEKEKDGEYREIIVFPILGEEEKVEKVILHIRDITDIRKNEEELIHARKKAEESDKMKSSFLANISHEIKTPMNAIIGFSQLLLDSEYDSQMKDRFLKTIYTNSNHLLELLNNIMDYAKVEAGELEVIYESFKVNELLEEIEDIFKDINYKKNMDSVKLTIEKRKKDHKIVSDYLRLKQVLSNIISNAIKYTYSGEIHLKTTIFNGIITFCVEDTGIGIPKNKIDKIFEKFVQVDDSSKKTVDGTGLGLTISKSIVEKLGGKIWVDSKLGEGSTFIFNIPFDSHNEIIKKSEINESGENLEEPVLDNVTAMLIEDVPSDYSLLSIIMRPKGVKSCWANTEKKVLRCLSKEDIKIAFIDMSVTQVNIYDITKKIKQFHKNIPIIGITTGKTKNNHYIDSWINKPFNKKIIFDILKKYV